MIDPKFNELVVEGEQSKKLDKGPKRQGLSINDTIAAAANKSIGAGGVSTSNVTAGLELDGQDADSRLSIEPVSFSFTRDEVALRAFEFWKERGCPAGSPEIDWELAEQDLLSRSRGSKALAAAV